MINQEDIYQVYFNSVEYTSFNPFSIKMKRDKVRLILDIGEIEIYGNDEFLKLWKLRETENTLPAVIKMNGQTIYESKISLNAAKFNISNHSVKVKLNKDEEDQNDLLKKYDTEVNLLQGDLKTVTYSDTPINEVFYSNYSEVELDYYSIFDYGFSFEILLPSTLPEWDSGTNYVSAPDYIDDDGNILSKIGTTTEYIAKEEHYCRYFSDNMFLCQNNNINTPPSNPSGDYNWIRVYTSYIPARIVKITRTIRTTSKIGYDTITNITTTSTTAINNGITKDTNYFAIPEIDTEVINYSMTRNWKFEDVMDNVVSNIFGGIGVLFEKSAGVNNWCTYLTTHAKYDNLYLHHTSDIKRSEETPPATFYNIRMSDFLKVLKNMFNLDWRINSDNYFQLIHPSEISNPTNVVDLSAITISKQQYNNKKADERRKESWKYLSSGSSLFDISSIVYENEGDEIETSIGNVINNYTICLGDNPDIPDISFGFFNLNGSDEIQNDNEDMAAINLMINNMLYERPNTVGFIDNVETAMENNFNIDLGPIVGRVGHINEVSLNTGFRTALTKKLTGNPVAFFDEITWNTDEYLQKIKITL